MKQVAVLLVLLLLTIPVLAQKEKQIDSLQQLITITEGAEQIPHLEAILDIFLFEAPNKVIPLSKELEKIAVQSNLKIKECKAIWYRARLHQMQANFDSLLFETKQGINLAKQLPSDSTLGGFYNFMGIYQEKVGTIDSAIHYYNLALNADGANKMALYNNLGLAFSRKGNPYESIKHLGLGMAEAQKQNNTNVEAIIANNIGQAHSDLNNTEQAKSYFTKSIELKDKIGDQRGKLFALINLLGLELPYDQHKTYLETAQSIAEEVDAPFFIRFLKGLEASFLQENGKYQEAINISLANLEDAKVGNGPDYDQFLILLANAQFDMKRLNIMP